MGRVGVGGRAWFSALPLLFLSVILLNFSKNVRFVRFYPPPPPLRTYVPNFV